MEKFTSNNSFCKKCKLYEGIKSPCMRGRGNINAKILILGEAPGKLENEQGVPFVGKSGQFFQEKINSIGLDCFISNAVRCWPHDGDKNKTPTPKEIEYCKPFTLDLIDTMKPKVILAVGKIALQQLIKTNMNMEVAHGKCFYYPELNTTIIPTFHPAYLLRTRDQRLIKAFMDDLWIARNKASEPESRKILSTPVSLSDPIEIKKYLEYLLTVPSFSVDLETTGLRHRYDRITDISFCAEIGKGVHIKWTDVVPEYEELLKKVLSGTNEKVLHNCQFDRLMLHAVGIPIESPTFDTLLAHHTLTMSYEGGTARSLYALKTMAWFMTSEGGYESILEPLGGIKGIQTKVAKVNENIKSEQTFLFDEKDGIRLDLTIDPEIDKHLLELYEKVNKRKEEQIKNMNLEPLHYYAAMDADVTYRIYKYLKPKIDKDYEYVFYNIIMPLNKVITLIKDTGVKLDVAHVNSMIAENKKEEEKLENEIYKKLDYKFNINSVDQLRDVVYNRLKIPIDQRFITERGGQPSTDERALSYFSNKAPVLKKILEYRGLQKQTNTYFEGFKNFLDLETGRIYPEYLQFSTATGRLSAVEPALHTVPRDNRIRRMIIPDEGCKLISCDLSQIELRILAMIAEDKAMIQAFESGHDFHTHTACTMFHIDIDKFDKINPQHKEARDSAKGVNFGLVYQSSAGSLANRLNISIAKADEFMRKFFTTYPSVFKWFTYIKQFAIQHGYVDTLYGRKRYLPYLYSSVKNLREGALRQAVNTVIQSVAGDVCFIGLIRLHQWLDKHKMKSKIIGTIHDSILIESPYDEVDNVAANISNLMTKDIPRITIELKADVDILDRWEKK